MRIPFARGGTPSRRIIHVAMADSHGGSVVGLLNPDHVLWRSHPAHDDMVPWSIEPNEMNRYLWEMLKEDIGRVTDLADGDDIVLSHVGDLNHGWKYSGHFPDAGPSDQWTIGFWNMFPWLALPNLKKLVLVTGTEAHDWMMGKSSEVEVARLIQGQFPGLDVTVTRHMDGEIGGVSFDEAHHGPGGGIRKWTHGNAAKLYLQDRVLRARSSGEEPAKVYIRGHFHTDVFKDWRDDWFDSRELRHIICLPSYCGVNWHALQSSKSDPGLHTGLYAFEIIDGRLVEIHRFVRVKDMRRKVRFV